MNAREIPRAIVPPPVKLAPLPSEGQFSLTLTCASIQVLSVYQQNRVYEIPPQGKENCIEIRRTHAQGGVSE